MNPSVPATFIVGPVDPKSISSRYMWSNLSIDRTLSAVRNDILDLGACKLINDTGLEGFYFFFFLFFLFLMYSIWPHNAVFCIKLARAIIILQCTIILHGKIQRGTFLSAILSVSFEFNS